LAVLAAAVGRLSRRPALAHCLWVLVLLKLVTPSFVVCPMAGPQKPEGPPTSAGTHAMGNRDPWMGGEPSSDPRPMQDEMADLAARPLLPPAAVLLAQAMEPALPVEEPLNSPSATVAPSGPVAPLGLSYSGQEAIA